MKLVNTLNYTVYTNKGKVTLAKCSTTGKFVKLALAQAELDNQYANKEDLYSSIAIVIFILLINIVFSISIEIGQALVLTFLTVLATMAISIGFDLFKVRYSPILNALKLI